MMNGKITYHQQVSFCGKPRCRKCREGTGHGPYWYAYETINGRTTRRYIGKDLPADAQTHLESSLAPEESSPAPVSTHDEKRPLLTEEAEVSTMASPLRLRVATLGRFDLEWGDGPRSQAVDEEAWEDQWSVRALLALLLCEPERKVSRQQALEKLWPRLRREVALHRMEETLSHLSRILTLPGPTSGKSQARRSICLLQLADDSIQLAQQSQAWVDATAFETVMRQLDDLPSSSTAQEREGLLREALTLYGGDFLPEGRQIEWIMQRRQHLRRRWITAQLALTDLYIQRGDFARALDSADRLLSVEANNEAAVQRLLIVLARLNRRPEALQVYKRLTQPSEQTRALYNAIRQGTLDDQALASLQAVPDPVQAQANTPELVSIQFAENTQNTHIGRTHRSPLIGREPELATLRHMLQDIDENGRLQLMEQRRATGIPLDTQRHPLCMILMGASGIGKTRLAEEMSTEAQQQGWAVVWGRSYDQESAIPYRLWTEIMRKVLNLGIWPQLISAGIVSNALNPSLRASVEETLLPLTDLLPELSELVPAQQRGSTHAGKSEHMQILQAEQKQLRLWEAVRDLLASTSESSPLLIVLDDIQWADDNSYKLLAYLARNLHGYPIMLLCTCRESEVPRHSPHQLRVIIDQMLREHSVETQEVRPLTGEQIATLVSHLPDSMVEHIKKQADGNPFFAEELARTDPPTIPRSIKAALQQRMNKLEKQTRQLLDTAAVLGGSFELSEICAMEVGGKDKGALADEDMIVSRLEEALDAGVLSEEGVGTHITYQFWHPMLVSYLYDSLSGMRRAILHRKAADMLRRMHKGREEEVAATIMNHLEKADADAALIAHYAQLAGDRAYILSATEPPYKSASAKTVPYTEAEQYYRRAIFYLQSACGYTIIQPATSNQQVPVILPPEEATKLKTEDKERFIYLLERIAECTMIRGNFEEARLLHAWVLALRSTRPRDNSSPAAQYEAQLQALLWAEIGWTWRYTGDVPKARSYLERGEQILRAAHVVAGPAWARLRHQQGSLSIMEGRYPEARLAMQEALSLFEQQQQPLTNQSGVSAARLTRIQRTLEGYLVDMGQTHKLLAALAEAEGRLYDSLSHLNTALSIFKECDHKRRMAHVYCDLGHINLKLGKYKTSGDFLQSSQLFAGQLGDEPLMGVIAWNQAELAAAPGQGDLEEAATLYRKAISYQERLNDREYLCKWNAYLAAVLQEQGKLDEAQTCVLRSLSIGRAMHNNHPCIGAALVALSTMRIALAERAQDLAELHAYHLRHALQTIERALALKELEAETRFKGQLTLVEILLLQGQKARAAEALAVFNQAEPKNEFVLLADQAHTLATQLQ
jgi:DNA-binding SARP family transcriptional activator